MDGMKWTDQELKARHEANLEDLERRMREKPELYSQWSKPYRQVTAGRLKGIKRMRYIWLQENHPQELKEMLMADTLSEHLRGIEDRTRSRQAQIMDGLMESRNLLNRTDVTAAHPGITDQARALGTAQAQRDAMGMAIHEVVESF